MVQKPESGLFNNTPVRNMQILNYNFVRPPITCRSQGAVRPKRGKGVEQTLVKLGVSQPYHFMGPQPQSSRKPMSSAWCFDGGGTMCNASMTLENLWIAYITPFISCKEYFAFTCIKPPPASNEHSYLRNVVNLLKPC